MRILIAEDEATIARALKVMLEKNKYAVDMVHNGSDALDYIQAVGYDALDYIQAVGYDALVLDSTMSMDIPRSIIKSSMAELSLSPDRLTA